MVDFLSWPILHLVSAVNTALLLWLGKELYAIKRDVSFLQGQFDLFLERRRGPR